MLVGGSRETGGTSKLEGLIPSYPGEGQLQTPSRDVHKDSMELWEAGMGAGKGLGALRDALHGVCGAQVMPRLCLHTQ